MPVVECFASDYEEIWFLVECSAYMGHQGKVKITCVTVVVVEPLPQ